MDSTLTNGAVKLGDTTVAGTFAWKNTETKPTVSDSGTVYYAVTTENTAPTDENLYSTSIPTSTDAGT